MTPRSKLGPPTPDVTYTYRPSGQVQERQFAGGPLVPLRYTIREQLETIGDPSSTAYPFAALYGYHANGTVAKAQFSSAGSPETNKRYRYLFDPSSYDALNRLTSANYQGWNGNWVATLAHDLAGIMYDAAGNITALQRYRENATLIDHLTYSYPGTSNRLSSVTDAVGVTAEPWDAESGAFTYDANGNLTTAPAPYAVTAVSYDQQSLPLTLTSSGTTTTYRYDHAGQRIAKQVGAGNTELYLLEGAATLGVVTVNGAGSAVSWHVTLLAGDKVVGRQPNVGNRKYYHTDLLGSTRAVAEGTTVVESYDFDPWGRLMPGRTLAGPTKEGFTSKERDAESGLDYFGARYYMAALGRWTAVDPVADWMPAWSAYNYAFSNPVLLVDRFGLAPEQCPPCPEPEAGPPVKLPPGKSGEPNFWEKTPGRGERANKWVPNDPISSPKGGQPGSSWDQDLGHWDVDDGQGNRRRFLPDGTEVDHSGKPIENPGPAEIRVPDAAKQDMSTPERLWRRFIDWVTAPPPLQWQAPYYSPTIPGYTPAPGWIPAGTPLPARPVMIPRLPILVW